MKTSKVSVGFALCILHFALTTLVGLGWWSLIVIIPLMILADKHLLDTMTYKALQKSLLRQIDDLCDQIKKENVPKQMVFTEQDMAYAHHCGWNAAYSVGKKQHQSSEEWVDEYIKTHKKPQ